MKPRILMVHGAFCGPWSFDLFRRPFELSGYAVEAVARTWHSGAFPKPAPERIERVREAVRQAAEALGVIDAAPVPKMLVQRMASVHYDAE